MTKTNLSSVHFETPPLNEVVFGVSFSGLKWDLVQFGLFFSEIRKDYPNTQMVNPLVPISEQRLNQGIKLMTEPDLPRLWYVSTDPSYILQIQKDRLLINWRKMPDAKTEYPHFNFFYKRFADEWKRFTEFCTRGGLGSPTPLNFELTYVNHLVEGTDWNKISDLGYYFKNLKGFADMTTAVGFGSDLIYLTNGFTVRNSFKRARLMNERKDVYIVELNVTHPINKQEDLKPIVDKANATLVEEFLKITTDDAHKKWGLVYGV